MPLFTSGSDQPFVIGKYAKAFAEQTKATRLDFINLGWGDNEMKILSEVLVKCTCLEEPWLS